MTSLTVPAARQIQRLHTDSVGWCARCPPRCNHRLCMRCPRDAARCIDLARARVVVTSSVLDKFVDAAGGQPLGREGDRRTPVYRYAAVVDAGLPARGS